MKIRQAFYRLCACITLTLLILMMLLVRMSAWDVKGQTSKRTNSKSRSPKATKNLPESRIQRSVNEFLTNWLVLKDDASTISFFAKEAFENRSILSEDCAGYIQAEARSDPKAVESGVRKFLSDFNVQVAGLRLDDILTTEGGPTMTSSRKAELLDIPGRNKYWLFQFSPDLLKGLGAEMEDQDYLMRQMKGKNAIVLYIQPRLKMDGELFTGALYFLWVPEKTGWKIIHTGMVCK
jgi:hypothetical protein